MQRTADPAPSMRCPGTGRVAFVRLMERVPAWKRRAYILAMRRAQRQIGSLETEAIRAVLTDLVEAKSRVLAALFATGSEFAAWNLPQVIKAIDVAMDAYVKDAGGTLRRYVEKAWDTGVARPGNAAAALGVDLPAGWQIGIDRRMVELAQGWSADLLQGEADSIVRRVTGYVRQGIAGGLQREELVRAIKPNLTRLFRFGTYRNRAETIVRTEVNRVHNAGHAQALDALQSSNVKVRKMWISSGDDRTRPAHRAMNGVTVDHDKPFPFDAAHVGEDSLPRSQWPQYPLDPSLPPEQSINCRCTIVEVFDVAEEGDTSDIEVEISA